MDLDTFSTMIRDRCVVLENASDVARFSFIAQNSVSYLDLKVCENARISSYFRPLSHRRISRRFRRFVNTEERCRQFFAPRRRIFYRLNLDLPAGREGSLKGDRPESVHYRRCCETPHIAAIKLACRFHTNNLSAFIEEAFSKGTPKKTMLEWILKVPFSRVPLLSRLEIETASKFLTCFRDEDTDSPLFKDFIRQFDLLKWTRKYERPEILEVLLYYARLHGNVSLDEEFDVEFISHCISCEHYRNVGSILKYMSYSTPTYIDYQDYLYLISSDRLDLTRDVIEKALESITEERRSRIVQIIWIFLDTQSPYLTIEYQKAASEALRLIWSSIPDACITFEELRAACEAAFSGEELKNVFDFYVKAIGEYHERVEPRSLQHLCRTAIRRRFQKNKLWIPDAIRRTGLPKSLQSFLNLEKQFST